jgi:hypothetical protein
MTNRYIKVNLAQVLLCCAVLIYTVELWSRVSFFEYALSSSDCSIQLRSAVPLKGSCGMIGFFMVRSAVTLDEIDMG